jgi:glutathione peroxidase
MMKMIWTIVAALLVIVVIGGIWASRAFSANMTRATAADAASIYDLQLESLAGEPVDMSTYRGTVALVVNTASKCGLTPQYDGLEALHRELAPEGFTVLGFPSNDFMGQEPGNPEEIMRFCRNNYDVSFPLFAKSKVKGDECGEVFQRLCAELEEPTWNFTKYVVGKDGRVIARFGPRTRPDNQRLRDTIERALAAAS